MTTLAVALARISALEERVKALEEGGGSTSSSATSDEVQQVEPLPDHLLSNAWADEVITRDPKKWKGPTQVNRKYSRAPVEWLETAARSYEFRAHMGRKETPVRLQERGKSAGKPWHEADTFRAKLLRAWAKRNANKAPPPQAKPEEDDWTSPASPPKDNSAPEDFNFGHNVKPPPPNDDVGF